ncbi:hypothetical protein BDU57DRAFT_523864 [Ampelomyces quisqualis]|uniref:Uncharacterized protein n=1 Tax=Ampelomyces quisqualis TaxID=50730 RepID=A0A6A5QAP1_AMPQU|nr:hypothetical protein BDU57DRAFT_523864 [Ampelomyces quisqualis]
MMKNLTHNLDYLIVFRLPCATILSFLHQLICIASATSCRKQSVSRREQVNSLN